MKKSVCIVGAGAAGLVTLKNILNSNSLCKTNGVQLEVIIFEQSRLIGGIWNLHNNDDLDSPLLSYCENAMYPDLKTNLPKEIMRFLDFSPENYEEDRRSFVAQSSVLKYLKKYADKHNLAEFIQFNRQVVNIKPILEEGSAAQSGTPPRWAVTIKNINNPSEDTILQLEFDFILICNGHFNKRKYPGNYPQILNLFRGIMLHSKDYKNPENFRDKNVVVIGAATSGIDISISISPFAKQVFLCTKDLNTFKLLNVESLKNFRQTPTIQIAKEYSVVLENGEEILCDVIIYCTGYDYEFPFLEDGIVEIKESGKHVSPLYLHMIHMKYNSLGFIGIPYTVIPFLMFDCQSKFYVSYIRGDLSLPTEYEMKSEFDQDLLLRKELGFGLDQKPHRLCFLQWSYFQTLAAGGGFTEELEPYLVQFKKLYHMVNQSIFKNPLYFRTVDSVKLLRDFDSLSNEEQHKLIPF